MLINFYHHTERLYMWGMSDDFIKKYRGRIEVFDIAEDEQLIGCELEHDRSNFRGVTWLKRKIPK
jgi:hypothetical protein